MTKHKPRASSPCHSGTRAAGTPTSVIPKARVKKVASQLPPSNPRPPRHLLQIAWAPNRPRFDPISTPNRPLFDPRSRYPEFQRAAGRVSTVSLIHGGAARPAMQKRSARPGTSVFRSDFNAATGFHSATALRERQRKSAARPTCFSEVNPIAFRSQCLRRPAIHPPPPR